MNKSAIISYMISAALIAAILYFIDVGEAITRIVSLGLLPALFAAGVYATTFVFRALRWKFLVKPVAEIKAKDSFYITNIGFLANNILPMRLGELIRAYLLGTNYDIGKLKGLSTVVTDRVIDGVMLVILFIVSLAFVENLATGFQQLIILPVVFFALLLLFFLRPRIFAKALKPLLKIAPGMEHKFRRLFNELSIGGKAFSQGISAQAAIWALSVLIWLVETFVYYFIAASLGIEISFFTALLLIAFVSLGVTIPSAPAYLGTFEALFAAVFLALGLSIETAVALAVTLHIIQFITVGVLGIVSLNRMGVSWANLVSLERLKGRNNE